MVIAAEIIVPVMTIINGMGPLVIYPSAMAPAPMVIVLDLITAHVSITLNGLDLYVIYLPVMSPA
jgi:hypothetical protein